MLKKKKQGIPSPERGPLSPQQTTEPTDKLYHIGFKMEEIDTIMNVMIELNVPVRTWLLLDSKFGEVKRLSMQPKQEVRGDTLVLQSKMNDEKTDPIPDYDICVQYEEGDRYIKRDPFRVYEIIKGRETEITIG